jgi:glycerophosphoryl diester phosphodiesterase
MFSFLLRSIVVAAAVSMAGTASFGQWIIGHRGASYDAPENTMASFRLALEQGADGFEVDLYLTSDGHVIAAHDKDTERTAGKKLLVTRAAFDELRALDVGSWKGPQWRGERMPTMEEVLAIVPADKKIVLDIKSGPEIVEPMARRIESSSLSPEQIMVISFNEDVVAESKKRLPAIRAHWLSSYKEQEDGRLAPTREQVAETIRRTGADGFGSKADTSHFDAEFIDYLRESGCREFHVWTVNEPKLARFYQRLGALWITTDRPGWLREKLDHLEE